MGHLFVERGLIDGAELEKKRDYLLQVVMLLKERCKLITDFPDRGEYFFVDPEIYERKGVKKHFNETAVADRLEVLAASFDALDDFTTKTTEATVRDFAEKNEVGSAKLIHPIRLAVTGVTYGPGLFELLEVIGREKVVSRMQRTAAYIRQMTT